MDSEYDRAEQLHRHHVEVLTRIEAQLRRDKATIRQLQASSRPPNVGKQHPELSSGHSMAVVNGVETPLRLEGLPRLPDGERPGLADCCAADQIIR
jgi:hypothetical protein